MWGVSGSNPEAVQRQVLLTKMESAMNKELLEVIENERWPETSSSYDLDGHNEAINRIAEFAKKAEQAEAEGKTTGSFSHAMQGIQSYRKNNPMYQINDLEWDDLIEAHNTDIAAKDKRIDSLVRYIQQTENRAALNLKRLQEAGQKIEALQNDLSIAQETCKRYRAQLAQRSGLVPADKAVR